MSRAHLGNQRLLGHIPSLEERTKISRANGGRAIIDQNGVVYPTLRGLARDLTLNRGEVKKVLSGERLEYRGYVFRYL